MNMQVSVKRTCPDCVGLGAAPGTHPIFCSLCSGHGHVRIRQTTHAGTTIFCRCPTEIRMHCDRQSAQVPAKSNAGQLKGGCAGEVMAGTAACPGCGATGIARQEWCTRCGGDGRAQTLVSVNVAIPAGAVSITQQNSKESVGDLARVARY